MKSEQIRDDKAHDDMISRALEDITAELLRAMDKHRGFPADPIHQAAIVVEESGEAMRAALQYVYERGDPVDVDDELVQCGAMCLRALIARRLHREYGDTVLQS